MDINHISVSRKKCFDTCSQQYKYKYHLKIPRPGEEPVYFAYGKIVHRVAEIYVEQKGEIPIGQIASDLLRGKYIFEESTPQSPPVPEDYVKKFPKHLRAIQNLTDKIGTDGIVEHPFYYDLDPPNKRFIKGFIDRLIIRGNKAFIIDYKTSKKSKWRLNKHTIKHDLQLRAYAKVVQQEFNIEAKNIKCALFYVEGENLVGCQYSQESLDKAIDDLKNAHITISKSDPDKVWGKVGYHCNHCDYNKMCPFFKPQSKKEASWDGDMSTINL